MKQLSHVDEQGKVRMVDVSPKPVSRRTAQARGTIVMSPKTVLLIRKSLLAKGDVLGVAKIAGIQAAKRTSDLIPLCHPIPVDHVDLAFEIGRDRVTVTSEVVSIARTGAEMEALTAVSVALLAVYDMVKAVDKGMVLSDIILLGKVKSHVR